MANRACCGNCAYADKSRNVMWCPFHDEPVRDNQICDDFLHTLESPQSTALFESLAEDKKKIAQYTGKDITAYVISFIAIILSAACFLVGRV